MQIATINFRFMFTHINFWILIILVSTGYIVLLYNINWYMITVYSNASEMECMYNLHNFQYKETHASFRMVPILYWYIMALYTQMSYLESVYYIHQSRPEKFFIDSVYAYCHEVLLCKSPSMQTKYICICSCNNSWHLAIQVCLQQGYTMIMHRYTWYFC